MPRLVRVLLPFVIGSLLLAPTFAGVAGKTEPVRDYEIKFRRPAPVGARMAITSTCSEETHLEGTRGGEKTTTTTTYKLEASGNVDVLGVHEDGATSKVAFTVGKLVFTVGNEPTELAPRGTVLIVERAKDDTTVAFRDGTAASIEEPALRMLGAALNLSAEASVSDDLAIGTTSRQRVGASWAANKEALAKQISSGEFVIASGDIEGTTGLVRVETVAGVPSMELVTKVAFRNPKTHLSGIDASVEGHVTTKTVLPVDTQSIFGSAETDLTMEIKAEGKGQDGKLASMVSHAQTHATLAVRPVTEQIAEVADPKPRDRSGKEILEATTADGRIVLLYPDASWRFKTAPVLSLPESARIAPATATASYTSKKSFVELWYDPKVWSSIRPMNESAEFMLRDSGGDIYAMLIVERLQIPRETLRGIVLDYAAKAESDPKVIEEQEVDVNGQKMLELVVDASPKSMPMRFMYHLWSGEQGIVQLIAFTSRNFFDPQRSKIVELLSGLKIVPAK